MIYFDKLHQIEGNNGRTINPFYLIHTEKGALRFCYKGISGNSKLYDERSSCDYIFYIMGCSSHRYGKDEMLTACHFLRKVNSQVNEFCKFKVLV